MEAKKHERNRRRRIVTRSRISNALNELQKKVRTKSTITEALKVCDQWASNLMVVCKKEEDDGYRFGIKNTRR